MKTIIRRLSEIHPGLVIAIHAIVLLVMFFGISRLELRNNDDADLPSNDPIVQTNKKFEKIFGNKDRVLISLESTDAFSVDSLTATRQIANDFVGLKWVVGNEIKSLATVKNIEASDDGLKVDTLYSTETLTQKTALDVKRDAMANPLIRGRVVSEDGRASLILINVVRGSDQAKVFEDTYRILEPYRSKFTVRVIGDLIFSEALDRGIESDAVVLFPIAAALQLLILFAMFRNVRLVLASMATTVVGIVWTMGIMGWMGYPITVVTTSIPVLIAIMGGSCAIHFVHTFLDERQVHGNASAAIEATVAKIWRPLYIACVTSAVGAYSLVVFKVSAIADFGVVTAIGTVLSLIAVVSLMPTLLKMQDKSNSLPKNGSVTPSGGAGLLAESVLTRIASASIVHPILTLTTYLLVVALCFLALTKLRTGANFAEYLPDGHATKTDMAYFDSHLGGSRYFEILVEAKDKDGIQEPDFLRRVEAIQAYAESLPDVGRTLSFVDVLKRIDKVIQNKPVGQIPSKFDEAAQYLLLYSISSSPEDFSDLVDYDYRRAKIFIPVKTSEQERHIEIYRDLREYIATQPGQPIQVEFGGNLLVWLAQMDYIITGKIENVFSSILGVIFFCGFFFRSLRYALLSVAPIIFSILCTFALMALIGIRLEVSTAVITGITIGIGIDFSCHFLHHYKLACERFGNDVAANVAHAIRSTGAAIIFNVVVSVIGFTVFVFSAFTPIQNFGYLISLNMVLSGLATFTLIPAMLAFKERSRVMSSVTNVEISDAIN